ncbi:multisubunit sodium/proton antiporter MrpE subunit [Brevibacterium sanguinis]|uniref:Multisubunit sodium/proton antiporter MrpE subunit n=2 Tax=Brevibacterium TaxID=1696 RepID=A0A366ILK8_9MICO|nr:MULTISPECIES: Na+/H+ antiporter subunit E [Brevibacterium]RBP67086.1 multisubunit sodium/proton antiporter MrpE subunit [Brevibacterium sanguinis]RBP73611.1 multisubunit sodium/proton antiporter MrpE subunit [Brevibacterium celere]
MSPHRARAPRQPHRARGFVQQLVLLFSLVVLWVMLWDTVSVLSVVSGLVVAMIIVRVFYLPPVILSGRFNVVHAFVFAMWFLHSLVLASVGVARMAFRPRAVGAGSVIACDLRTSSDLLMTLIADTASLIPGSIIIDADRAHGVLYLHVLDADSEEKVLSAKREVYVIERLLIRALGSHRDLAELRMNPDPMARADGGAR